MAKPKPKVSSHLSDKNKDNANVDNANLWNSLSKSEKEEVLVAYEESKNERNLVSHEAVMKKGIIAKNGW